MLEFASLRISTDVCWPAWATLSAGTIWEYAGWSGKSDFCIGRKSKASLL
jgi:hypothetical protein